MSCVSPIDAWRSRERSKNGKRRLVFNPAEGYRDMHLTIACGKCIGCLRDRARNWAVRCAHEIAVNDENCFVTLTYDDENLPKHGVDIDHFQRFMKRLRYKYSEKKIKHYGVGEYGSEFGRPHYHVLLFGHDFSDKTYWALRNESKSYRSASLERLWPYGNSEVGEANFTSASYVARYLTKDYQKGIGQKGVREWRKALGINPEFCSMSRGGRKKGSHGLGYEWFEQFHEELLKFDSIIIQGSPLSPARYYDDLLGERYPEEAAKIKRNRRGGNIPRPDKTTRQLYADKKILEAKIRTQTKGDLHEGYV